MNEQEKNQRERDKQDARNIGAYIEACRNSDSLLNDFISVALSSYLTGFNSGVRADKSIQSAAV